MSTSKQTTTIVILSAEYTYIDGNYDEIFKKNTIVAPLTDKNKRVVSDLWSEGYVIKVITKCPSLIMYRVEGVNLSLTNFFE